MDGRPARDRLVLGTRTSDLALHQTRRIAERLGDAWPDLTVETAGVTTEGDRVLDRPLPELGGKGLFTAELEEALRAGEVDAAVHSLKDLPTDMDPAFAVIGVPERADPRDVLLGPDGPLAPEELAGGAVVGTSSLRRRAQLLRLRPDCEVRDVRGNVGTRVEKMRRGDYDAVLLAAAGLLRLELIEPGDGPFLEPPGWLPAPGQGAIGVEGRADDDATRSMIAAIEAEPVRAEATAERALLATLEAGCSVPVGGLARAEEGNVRLDAVVLSEDGERELRASGEAPFALADELGRRLGRQLLERGAAELLRGAEEEA